MPSTRGRSQPPVSRDQVRIQSFTTNHSGEVTIARCKVLADQIMVSDRKPGEPLLDKLSVESIKALQTRAAIVASMCGVEPFPSGFKALNTWSAVTLGKPLQIREHYAGIYELASVANFLNDAMSELTELPQKIRDKVPAMDQRIWLLSEMRWMRMNASATFLESYTEGASIRVYDYQVRTHDSFIKAVTELLLQLAPLTWPK